MVELIVSFQFSYMDEKMPLFFRFLFSSNFTCICELLEKKIFALVYVSESGVLFGSLSFSDIFAYFNGLTWMKLKGIEP